MGRTLLILLAGFAASFGVLAMSKNQRIVNSVDMMAEQFADYNARNAASSGAYMALNQLYLNPAWRGSYNNLMIGGNALNVTVTDDSAGTTPLAHRIRITSSAGNAEASGLVRISVFDSEFKEFAVWAKKTAINVTTQDSLGVGDPDLLMQNAPFMPKVNYDSLYATATGQGQLKNNDNAGHYHPSDGYPNGSFYYDSTATPKVVNVIHIGGDLHVKANLTVYGIYIVEGNVLLDANAMIRGVIYLPNLSSQIYNNQSADSQVTGGILTWGTIDGKGYQIVVKHRPEYLRKLVSNYASNNPPIRVLSWK